MFSANIECRACGQSLSSLGLYLSLSGSLWRPLHNERLLVVEFLISSLILREMFFSEEHFPLWWRSLVESSWKSSWIHVLGHNSCVCQDSSNVSDCSRPVLWFSINCLRLHIKLKQHSQIMDREDESVFVLGFGYISGERQIEWDHFHNVLWVFRVPFSNALVWIQNNAALLHT